MLRRVLIVSAVVATCLGAAPVFAVTLSGTACSIETTTANVTVGVGAGPEGAVVCVDDNGSYHHAEIGTATAVERDTSTIVAVGGGANACVFSDYACTTAGGTVFAITYDDTVAPVVYLPSVCTQHVQDYYSRCAMVMTGATVDGTATPHAYVYLCEDVVNMVDPTRHFACTSGLDEVKRATVHAVDNNTEPVTVDH